MKHATLRASPAGGQRHGNTVVVIEHNLDVIKTADWIIGLGPEGGSAGGRVVAEGTPEAVAMVEGSYTGQFLKDVVRKNRFREGRRLIPSLFFLGEVLRLS